MAHWGAFEARAADGEIVDVRPWSGDRSPSAMLRNIPGSVRHRSRVARPAVRRGWWEHGPGASDGRGRDDYVEPGWDEVLDRLAAELRRVSDEHGNEAIYAGSYGWGSAGRFHHAQAQLHRFLSCVGGFTRSVGTYSSGAAEVILPRIAADHDAMITRGTTWDLLGRYTELLVCFGGLPTRTTAVAYGGAGDHPLPATLRLMAARGVPMVSISPIRDDMDLPDLPDVEWIAPRPGTDVALMLALMFVLVIESRYKHMFVLQYTHGLDQLEAYLRGTDDGMPKTPDWAAEICDVPAETIANLARRMAASRTFISTTYSLQRAEHGEMATWASLALAALVGQLGLRGGGYGHGYGSINTAGLSPAPFAFPSLPAVRNPVSTYVPVAAISDLLLHPGTTIPYDGREITLPDTRLVWWAGGNPFHHHQDLQRLTRALARPETIVVADPYWTPMARHADIVLPSTTSYERDDLGGHQSTALLVAMHALVPPYAEARDDYATLAELARRMDVEEEFTGGRNAAGWVKHLYESWRTSVVRGWIAAPTGDRPRLPGFDQFWAEGFLSVPRVGTQTAFSDYRASPRAHRLSTPSGRIELYSPTIAELDLPDCPPHPAWLEPQEWLGGPRAVQFPLHLIANQPRGRLHGQLDHGATSAATKVAGREPVRIHPSDAQARGLSSGDVVKVFNDRGACLAGVVLEEGLRPGVVQLATGAWYDPQEIDGELICVHGNPNVLTADRRTSSLAQAATGQHVLVDVVKWTGPVPELRCYDPPVAPS